jgi:adenosylhomocysteine nucleosidase
MIAEFIALGIMSAMPQEAEQIKAQILDPHVVAIGNREFICGTLDEVPVVFVLSGIGKVAAAATAALLIERFHVEEIFFTGVAGGGAATAIGDLVIGTSFVQHDLNLQPIFPRYYIYSLQQERIDADAEQCARAYKAAEKFFAQGIAFPELGIDYPRIHRGPIVTGDQFISDPKIVAAIDAATRSLLPEGFCALEMEGAAVAQVCRELGVPCTVIRAISDKADRHAAVDFTAFMEKVGSTYSVGVLREYLRLTKPVRFLSPVQNTTEE